MTLEKWIPSSVRRKSLPRCKEWKQGRCTAVSVAARPSAFTPRWLSLVTATSTGRKGRKGWADWDCGRAMNCTLKRIFFISSLGEKL